MHAAVDVASLADRHRLIDAGDRAGGGDRLAGRRGGTALAAELDALAARVVAGDDSQIALERPGASGRSLDQRANPLGAEHAARQEARDERAAVARSEHQPQRPRPERQRQAREPQRHRVVRVEVGQHVGGIAAQVRRHRAGRQLGGDQRRDQGADRGAEDDRRLTRAKAAVLLQRVERPKHP